jgi:hypothetical protein
MKMASELELRAGEIAKELAEAAANREAANEADFAGFADAKPKMLDGEILPKLPKEPGWVDDGKPLDRRRWRDLNLKPEPKPAPEPEKVEDAGPLRGTEAAPKASTPAGAAIQSLIGNRAQLLIEELARVFKSDDSLGRLQYNNQKAEVAEALGVFPMDVHRAMKKWIDDKDEEKKKTKELTPGQKVIALSYGEHIALWADPGEEVAYASICAAGHWENYKIGSSDFERWLIREYGRRHWYEMDGRRIPSIIKREAYNEGIGVMEARAFEGQKIIPRLRVGGEGGRVWLDLGRDDWMLIKVTAEGWEEFREGVPGVAFIRRPGMLPLPVPERGGDIRELGKFLNVKTDDDLALQSGWLVGTLMPEGPYPVDAVIGSGDTGKTTFCLTLQKMVDPKRAGLRPFSRSEDDAMVAARNGWVQAYDNISKVTPEQADLLCRISTGIGYMKRALRTDAEPFIMEACRPQLLNGIPENLAERGDLATRTIVVELPTINAEKHQDDPEFWEGFQEAHPRMLGALLDGVAGALRNANRVSLDRRIRMSHFAKWAEAGCRAMGFREDQFLTTFVANQERAMGIAFKQDYVAQAVALLMEQQPVNELGEKVWRGNAQPLLKALNEAVQRSKEGWMVWEEGWPKNPTWLGRQLRRSAAVLRKAVKIEVKFDVNLEKVVPGGYKDGLEIIKNLGPRRE